MSREALTPTQLAEQIRQEQSHPPELLYSYTVTDKDGGRRTIDLEQFLRDNAFISTDGTLTRVTFKQLESALRKLLGRNFNLQVIALNILEDLRFFPQYHLIDIAGKELKGEPKEWPKDVHTKPMDKGRHWARQPGYAFEPNPVWESEAQIQAIQEKVRDTVRILPKQDSHKVHALIDYIFATMAQVGPVKLLDYMRGGSNHSRDILDLHHLGDFDWGRVTTALEKVLESEGLLRTTVKRPRG